MRAPSKQDGAGIGPVQAVDQVEDRGLAGAVRPDQRRDAAFLDRKRAAVDRVDAAEGLAQIADLEERQAPCPPGNRLQRYQAGFGQSRGAVPGNWPTG